MRIAAAVVAGAAIGVLYVLTGALVLLGVGLALALCLLPDGER